MTPGGAEDRKGPLQPETEFRAGQGGHNQGSGHTQACPPRRAPAACGHTCAHTPARTCVLTLRYADSHARASTPICARMYVCPLSHTPMHTHTPQGPGLGLPVPDGKLSNASRPPVSHLHRDIVAPNTACHGWGVAGSLCPVPAAGPGLSPPPVTAPVPTCVERCGSWGGRASRTGSCEASGGASGNVSDERGSSHTGRPASPETPLTPPAAPRPQGSLGWEHDSGRAGVGRGRAPGSWAS